MPAIQTPGQRQHHRTLNGLAEQRRDRRFTSSIARNRRHSALPTSNTVGRVVEPSLSSSAFTDRRGEWTEDK